LLNPSVMRDGMHDWVAANHRMAKVLKEQGYEYQYLFCRGAGHSIGNAQAQFLPHAIEWVWKGYAPKEGKQPSLLPLPSRRLPARPVSLRLQWPGTPRDGAAPGVV
jgi:hypothetical protein